jgi:hypothetical protein
MIFENLLGGACSCLPYIAGDCSGSDHPSGEKVDGRKVHSKSSKEENPHPRDEYPRQRIGDQIDEAIAGTTGA